MSNSDRIDWVGSDKSIIIQRVVCLVSSLISIVLVVIYRLMSIYKPNDVSSKLHSIYDYSLLLIPVLIGLSFLVAISSSVNSSLIVLRMYLNKKANANTRLNLLLLSPSYVVIMSYLAYVVYLFTDNYYFIKKLLFNS